MPETVNPKLLSWASEVDPGTIRQAEKTARLPIVEGHVALMPDAHVGIGATVGSVIPTKGAIIPSAVGVDIGCGMIAAELDVTESQLPDNLEPLLHRIGRAVPAGVGQGHSGKRGAAAESAGKAADSWLATHRPATVLSADQAKKAANQFGSLGSGNHFFELCIDERKRVWVVLHSGKQGHRQPAGPGAHRQGEAAGQGSHALARGSRPGLVRPGNVGVRRLRDRHALGPGLRPGQP